LDASVRGAWDEPTMEGKIFISRWLTELKNGSGAWDTGGKNAGIKAGGPLKIV